MNEFYYYQYLVGGITMLMFGLLTSYAGYKIRQNIDPDGMGALIFIVGIIVVIVGVLLLFASEGMK